MESFQIYLNSELRTTGSIEDAEYTFNLVEIARGNYMHISMVHATIPYSFYNVNSNTNKLILLVNSVQSTITIVNGNYNINQLVTYLSNVMTNFTITYDEIINKLTFVHSIYNFSFLSSSTCLSMLGFLPLTLITSSSLSLTSSICVSMQTIKRINLQSSLMTHNLNIGDQSNYTILCSIPINNQPFTIIEYENLNNFKTNLFINYLSNIRIKLVDEVGTAIDLNGWSLFFNFTNRCITI